MPPDETKRPPRLDIDTIFASPPEPYDDAIGRRVYAAVDEARRSYERANRLTDGLLNADLHGPVVMRGFGDALLTQEEALVRAIVSELHAGLHSVREAVALAHGTTARPTAWERLAGDDEE
jgi:hypothetical protein